MTYTVTDEFFAPNGTHLIAVDKPIDKWPKSVTADNEVINVSLQHNPYWLTAHTRKELIGKTISFDEIV